MYRYEYETVSCDAHPAGVQVGALAPATFTALMIIVPLSTREPRTAGDMSVAFLQNSEEPDIPRRWI